MSTEPEDDLSPSDDIKASIREAMAGAEAPAPEVEAPEDDDETPPMQGFERARDEHGRFAKTEQTDPNAPPDLRKVVDTSAEGEPTPGAPPGEAEPQYTPPPGFSPQTKAEWDMLPPYVKADIAKRENEFSNGIRQYSDKLKETAWVDTLFKPYDNELHASGMTREQIVRNWANAEIQLNRDPVAGIRSIMQAYGVTPDMIGAQPQAAYNYQPPQGAVPPQVLQTLQELQQWKTQREQIEHHREEQRVVSDIEKFASDPKHRFFHNVQDTMAKLISNGMAKGLDDAYEQACYMDPAIRPYLSAGNGQQAAQVAAAAKARASAKSIRSSGGASVPARAQAPAGANHRDDILETLRAAMAEHSQAV